MVKKIVAIILIISLIVPITTISYADTTARDTDAITSGVKGMFSGGGDETVKTAGKKIIGLVRGIGIAVALIMLVIIGIRYITASASAESKAQISKQIMPYVIGLALIIVTTTILSILYSLGDKINKV